MNKTWQANWIGKREFSGEHAPVYRKIFNLEKIPEQCNIFISGLGTYVMHVNGKRVGEDILQPAFSNYDKTVYYNEYSLKDYIIKGENTIEVTLGNYFYNEQQTTAWEFEHAPWKAFPRLISEIFADGELIVKTDRTWDCAKSKTIFNSLRCGERYDALFEVRYLDKADVVLPPGGILTKQTIAPIRVRNTYKAKLVENASNARVYDFGINISGNVEIRGKGRPGEKITLIYFETILDNKWPDLYNLNAGLSNPSMGQTDEYIFSGNGEEIWHSEFGYNGFRYVMVWGGCEELELTARCFHTDLQQAGDIECDNELIMKIHSAVKHSTLTNYHHIPTDCPHREKLGWTGDAYLSAEQSQLDFDMTVAYEKWMRDFRESQQANGKVPCIVPSNGWGYSFMDNGPSFDIAIIILPWQMYRYTGDKKHLKDSYEAMKSYLQYMRMLLEDGLCYTGIAEWVPLWHRGDRIPREAIISMDCGYAVDIFSRIAKLFGKNEDYNEAQLLYNEIRNAFRKKFGNLKLNNQLFYAAQLMMNFADDREKALEGLMEAVEYSDYHITGGLFCSKYLLDALTNNGKFEVAYKIASQKDFPGWGDLTERCSGTLGEDWFGGKSGNHHFLSEIGAWYYKALAGFNIDDENPGFKHIILTPHIPDDIRNFRAYHETPFGHLEISWNEKEINIIIPDASTASFSYKDINKELTGGTYTFER